MTEHAQEAVYSEKDIREEDRGPKTLYGTPLSQADARNVVGFCRRHGGYITANQLRRKQCLKKACHHLEKIENQFWTDREERKAAKKKKRG